MNTPETAYPVRELNTQIKGWIDRLGSVWVEGQLTGIRYRPGARVQFFTLRDTQAEASISIMVPAGVLAALPSPPRDGDRVVLLGKINFYVNRASLSLVAERIQLVGIGELLQRIELLRRKLAEQGLFAPERKKPLPFLPQCIGLITGRASAAERDVQAVAQSRWPGVRFRVINTIVQGPQAVPEIVDALHILDADPQVDVIIIARGGGSFEDLLPFSEELLIREVASATTPVVSAIGHEPDTPILDNVADLRAATPTDAAKRVVPDVAAEHAHIAEFRERARGSLRAWVKRQRDALETLRTRPALADPLRYVRSERSAMDNAVERLRRAIHVQLTTAYTETASLRARISTLGPAATLARGYAIVQVQARSTDSQQGDPQVVTSIEQTPPGTNLRIRVADGSISAAAMGVHPAQ